MLPLVRRSAYMGHLSVQSLSIMLGLALLNTSACAQYATQPDRKTSSPAPATNAQLAFPAIERRVDALLKQMTLEEKLGQLVQYDDSNTGPDASQTPSRTLSQTPSQPAPETAAANNAAVTANPKAHHPANPMLLASKGLLGSMVSTVGAAHTDVFQHAAVEKTRLHIPLLFSADVIHGFHTMYPVPLGLAATFDPDLVASLSHMAAGEAASAGIRWVYSPMVDISRDARWGRTSEGAGEDPYLGAAMARAYIRGYQGGSQGNDLSKLDSVAAGVKHFAAYGAAEAGREYNTTDMSQSRLRQVYLPPYKAAVEAGAATVMSAFTSLNGVPITASTFLLQQVLRDQWGFNGLVVSDWMAIMELQDHGVALDAAAASRKAITAGVDVDMMSHFYDTELGAQVQSGKLPIALIDESVRRVLRLKFALGLFEHPYVQGQEVTATVSAHRPIVRHAAEESFVLLQNNRIGNAPLLPLANHRQTIALIGPLADDSQDMIVDNSEVRRPAPDAITLRQALTERAGKTGGTLVYAQGTDLFRSSDQGFAQALEAARHADVVVLALGESAAMSGEAGSRANLDLPGNQQQLLEAVAATGRPIVLLVFSGRPLVLAWAKEHVPSIMEAWFPGTEAGSALANVLYGDISPSGKLPMSFPRVVGQEPLYYNQFSTGRPAGSADLTPPATGGARFLSRYIDIENDALFPFGYGLSYSHFSYGDASLSRHVVPLHEARHEDARKLITASVKLKNDGDRPATEIVQCYVGNVGASLVQPMRSLQGFKRVTLNAGESRVISFELGFPELSFFNNDGQATIEATDYTVWLGGSSLATQHAEFKVTP